MKKATNPDLEAMKLNYNCGRLVISYLIIAFVFTLKTSGQPEFRPSIEGEYPASVFVVTNRMIDTVENSMLIFTNKVDIARGLKFLKITFTNDEWFAESYENLEELLANPAPYSDWAVWVHGDGQSFLLSMKRALEIQYLHKVNFIVFAWPTQAPDKGPIANFKNSRGNALQTVPDLHELFKELQEYRNKDNNQLKDANLSIFFHSLGNYLLENAVEKGALKDIEKGFFDNLMINEAAVESKDHNKWVEQLDVQKRIYIAYNDEDVNLEGLRVLSSLGVQLGERPLQPLAENAVYVDFTEAVGFRIKTGATHSYYYDLMTEISPNIREFYRELFHGRQINFEDQTRFETTGSDQVIKIKF